MDIGLYIGSAVFIALLTAGAWLCFTHAGRYDAESLQADVAASREASIRAHRSPPPARAANDYHRLDRAA